MIDVFVTTLLRVRALRVRARIRANLGC